MRKIKFRAFDAATKQYWVPKPQRMIYFDIMHVPDFIGNTHNENIADGKEIWERRFSIMQFTGMQDKNGVQIYEGDVVSVFCDDEFVFNHTVLFDSEVCAYVIDVSCCDYDTTTMIWAKQMNYYEYEVIGNIHQHAHLLEQNKC